MNLLDLVPRFRGRATCDVGVDVGVRAVKAVHRRGARLDRSLVPWDGGPELIESGDARERLGEAIRRATAPFALTRRSRAACVLSPAFGVLRNLELPVGTEEETRAMTLEAFASEETLDPAKVELALWHAPTRTELQSVCGWALGHATSTCVCDAFAIAGLECTWIDSLPLALARAVHSADRPPEEPVAAVDCGATAASLTIVERGEPRYTRLLRDCGQNRVVDGLVQGLGLSVDEAWSFYDEYSAGRETSRELRPLFEDHRSRATEELVREVSRTIDFLQGRLPRIAPRSVVLFGGGASLLVEPLNAVFEGPVTAWRDESRKSRSASLAPRFAAAAALAGTEVLA